MNVRCLGSVAAELLERSHTAVVQGRTRQGVFLRLDTGWMIYLTHEAEHGPLTLNIEEEAGILDSFSMGSQVPIHHAEQSEASQALLINSPQVWSAPPRPADALPTSERVYAVAVTIKQAQSIRPTASLTALQAVLAGTIQTPDGEAGHFYSHLSRISALLAGPQRSAVAAFPSPLRQLDPHSLYALLGLGTGLTPSGDDIVLGMLLALNRWRSVLAPGLDVGLLNRDVLVQAYQRTTTISANLIECAARGQADERLVTALDGLVTGAPGPVEAAGLLAQWGKSSGLDALCGMALVFEGTPG